MEKCMFKYLQENRKYPLKRGIFNDVRKRTVPKRTSYNIIGDVNEKYNKKSI